MEKNSLSISKSKILILYVDKDDDVGRTTGFRTPIIGKDKNIEVALRFAVSSPEDSDVNALFAALKIYNEMKKSNMDCEIATLSGEAEGGLKADIKIRSELDEVLSVYQASGVIFVSDGAADELIIPIIQSRIPIISVKRIVIQQERGIEETYILLARYLRKLVEEAQYARLFLGIPGIIFLLLAVLYALGYSQYAGIGTLFIIGIAFIVRGFSIDTRVIGWLKSSPAIFFSTLTGILSIFISIYIGLGKVVSEVSINQSLMGNWAFLSGTFIDVSSDIILVGVAIISIGRLIDKILKKTGKIWHNAVSLTFIITIRPLLKELAQMLIKQEYIVQTIIAQLILPATATIVLIVFFTLLEEVRRRIK
ncbi:MAG: DUF373 family protein [Candidatus Methanomethylicia archaeon]|nr:DUF373 family protein [Candidatus Methanomethylicia archaeon]MCX8169210.1 DUF373 family protein [Candidatus Methanomethylicia archaeon]MDW7989008.1 DUF373 family protein [Nitrososphaerota archaeon]